MIVFCSIIRQMRRICEKKRKQIYANSASCFPQLADIAPDELRRTQKQAVPLPSVFAPPHSQVCLSFLYTTCYNFQINHNEYTRFRALSAYSIARLLQKINTI